MINLKIAPYHFGPDHRLLILENEGENSLKRIARVDPRLPNGQGPKLARLFAAAPDLLAACKAVDTFFVFFDTIVPPDKGSGAREALQMIRTAIAKAHNS